MTAEQKARFESIITRYAALDDAEYILSASVAEFRALLGKYSEEIAQFLVSFIDPKILEKITQQAAKDYLTALARQIASGALKKQIIDRRRLVESILQTWKDQAETIAKNNLANLTAKATQFQALAQTAEIPVQRLREIENLELTAVRIGGRLYKYRELSSLWDRMNETYGQRDTIQFRNGVNYPMRSYVDSRAVTTEAETHRLATIIEAAADGVWLATTNKTGTTDSCIYHEGEVFFVTDEAREQARQRIGALASHFSTWQEIVRDRTHMGKFNCRHVVRPVPWQFLRDEKFVGRMKEAAKELPKIPNKIDERKIFEQQTGRKWESSSTPREANYKKIIPPRGPAPTRYTIA